MILQKAWKTMEYRHAPVMLNECMENLSIKQEGTYVDGTLGGGGHSKGICERLGGEGTFIGIDRDKEALAAASTRLKKYSCRKHFFQSNYVYIKKILNRLDVKQIDGMLLDLGVSSFQLDNAKRGFSYMRDAPLDMRMDQDDALTAWQVINTYNKKQLTRVIKDYGEERWASRISEFIVESRKKHSIDTTLQLVDIIKAAIPAKARREGPHPAKRTFQAIRIEVNDELNQLKHAVEDFCDVTAPGGRILIITFHSLEDRIVKDIFARREDPCICPKELPVCVCGRVQDIKRISKKPIVAKAEEVDNNPRARSAKLRVAEKLHGN